MKKDSGFTSCIRFLALVGVLCGIVSAAAQAQPFLPLPIRVPDTLTGDSRPETFTYSGSAPQVGTRGNRVDALIREADWHFQLGRKHYQDGDYESARREFDRAIDVLLGAPESSLALRGPVERKIEELVQAIHRLDLAGLGGGDTGEPAFEKSPLEEITELTFPVDPKLKDKVLEEVRATVSQLPLQVTDAVLSYINYFSSERGRKVMLFGLRRAGRYKALIQRILDEEGVPQELIFAAQAESAFMPRAISRKRAVGMWQFVAARGRQYGLAQSPHVDERLDFEKATRAAAQHFRDLYQRYGDWYLAMAAYNAGPGVVDRAVERTGYADFWEFRRRNVLPRETANYVPIILAMTIMVKNAREYNLEDVVPDPPISYDTLALTAPTSLRLIADLTEAPVSELRNLNPALLKEVAPAGVLRIPKGSPTQLAAVLDRIPEDRRLAWRLHRVADGDTIASIARKYGVTESAVASVNADLYDGASVGEMLIIPAAAQRTVGSKAPAARRAVRGRSHSVALRADGVKRPAAKRSSRSASARGSKKTTGKLAYNARAPRHVKR